MIYPKREWKEFNTLDEKIEVLRKLEIISPKATEIKKLFYKGAYVEKPTECDVVGYVDDNEIILNINNNLHSIHPDYFVEMQKRERFIVIDIETGSFPPSSGIREVAAVYVEDYAVVDSIHLSIITDENLYKKGYGKGLAAIEENEDLKDQFKKFITKYKVPMIAHNASFERSFLKYWNWIDEKQKFYCSMYNLKSRLNLENHKLLTILKHFNIADSQSHLAMQDVLDLLEVLKITKIDKWAFLGEASESKSKERKAVPNNKFSKVSKEDREKNKEKLETAKECIIKDIFNGKKLVFTGDMSKERIDMMEIAIKHGATTATSISKKTDIVVLGQNPGKSKLAKAIELGIKMMSEVEFLDMIETS